MANINKNEKLQSVLSDIKAQISSFDQKAGILLSTVGIVYALLLDFAIIFSNEWFKESTNGLKWLVYVFFFSMLLFGLACILLFVLSVLPRRRKKDGEKHPNYYGDIASMDAEELTKAFNDFCTNDLVLEKQIIINSKICNMKHKFIFGGILCLIPYSVSIIGLLISIVCVA